jgi:dUTP pyrophosphatase
MIGIKPINQINIFCLNNLKMTKKNNNIEVLIKKNYPDAKLPTYSKEGDAAMDLYAHSIKPNVEANRDAYMEYDTGISVKIPEGHVGLLFPRSSISKTPYILANSVGVVDSNYIGAVKLRFKVDATLIQHDLMGNIDLETYSVGDRIGQLMIVPIPTIQLKEITELPDTNRGAGGFGSSGK